MFAKLEVESIITPLLQKTDLMSKYGIPNIVRDMMVKLTEVGQETYHWVFIGTITFDLGRLWTSQNLYTK